MEKEGKRSGKNPRRTVTSESSKRCKIKRRALELLREKAKVDSYTEIPVGLNLAAREKRETFTPVTLMRYCSRGESAPTTDLCPADLPCRP